MSGLFRRNPKPDPPPTAAPPLTAPPASAPAASSVQPQQQSQFDPHNGYSAGVPVDPVVTAPLYDPDLMGRQQSNSSDIAADMERMSLAERQRQGGEAKKVKQAISYAAERVIGNGSFGVVYQATVIETSETVAIKKVLQDRRFKNRELQIMGMLDHPDVVTLKHCFYSKGEKPEEVFLNLVMEYIPETIHRTVRNHTKAKKLVPLMYTKVYMYQICRSLAYIHSLGICHRDIKPQNLLLDTQSHRVKLCDFGSAKILLKGQPNVAYICSRYYRAPELIFEATEYTTKIDIWSMGCVMAELLLGTPLFAGENNVDQLIEIIKILGTPRNDEIKAMNPNHNAFKFPQIKPHPWSRVFRGKASPEAIDLVSKFLRYKPQDRLHPFEALAHPFFNELRDPTQTLPNAKSFPPFFNFTDEELKTMVRRNLVKKLIPPHEMKNLKSRMDALGLDEKTIAAAAAAAVTAASSAAQSSSGSSVSGSVSASPSLSARSSSSSLRSGPPDPSGNS